MASSFTLGAGAPRFGSVVPPSPGAKGKGSVEARLTAAYTTALVGGGLTVASGVLLVPWVLDPLAWAPLTLALWTALPLAGVASAWGLVARIRKVGGEGAWALATLALVLAGGAVLVHLDPVPLLRYTPRQLALLTFGLTALPTLAGLLARSHALSVDASGAFPRRAPLLAVLRWNPRTGTFDGRAHGPGRILAHCLLDGWALGGRLVLDLARTTLLRGFLRTRGWIRDRVHADVPRDALEAALDSLDVPHERRGRHVLARVTPGEPPVWFTPRALAFPKVAHPKVLDFTGPPAAVRWARTFVEDHLLYSATFTWSADARRLEANVNRLHADAVRATTVEERAILADAAKALRTRVEERALLEEEATLLARVKLTRIELFLDERLLSEPPGPKDPSRRVTPHACIPVNPNAVVGKAGLLGARGAVSYVPYWVVPVATRWGELTFVINALTRRRLDREDAAVWRTLVAKAPGHFVPTDLRSEFLPAPHTLGTVYAEVRKWLRHTVGYRGPFHLMEQAVETVHVPYFNLGEVWVNGATGTEVPSIRGEPAPAEPAPPVTQ